MRRFFLTTILIVLVSSTVATVVFAQDTLSNQQVQTNAFAGDQGANLGTPRDPRIVVAYTIQVLLTLSGTLFLGYAVYAGFLIMMARGDDAEITKGKETLKTAVIGMVIILSSYSLTLFAARIALSSSGKCYQTDIWGFFKGQNNFKEISCAQYQTDTTGSVNPENPKYFIKQDPLGR